MKETRDSQLTTVQRTALSDCARSLQDAGEEDELEIKVRWQLLLKIQ